MRTQKRSFTPLSMLLTVTLIAASLLGVATVRSDQASAAVIPASGNAQFKYLPAAGLVSLTVQFVNSSTFPQGATLPTAYSWDFEGDGTIDVVKPNMNAFSYTYTTPGVYRPTLSFSTVSGPSVATHGTVNVWGSGAVWGALGDSFSSGDGAENYLDNACRRSNNAYSQITARSVTPPTPAVMNFRACTGAVTSNVWDYAQGGGKDSLAQLDYLGVSPGQINNNVGLVTLTIGENDLGFRNILNDCITNLLLTCKRFDTQIKTALTTILPAAWGQTFTKIIQRAPSARIVVLGYPQLFKSPRTGVSCNGVDSSEQIWANDMIRLVNGTLKTQVEGLERGGAELNIQFADVDQFFAKSRLCDSVQWINPFSSGDIAFYPNVGGQGAYSRALLTQIKNVWQTTLPNNGIFKIVVPAATAIAAGGRHSCGLLTGGTIKCWGNNDSGQLGDGTSTDSSVPVLVSAITSATAITAGTFHSCALLSGGTIKCWGSNWARQLGDGTNTGSSVPVLVSGITNATAITAGNGHTCALLVGGTIKCWGNYASGQLGDGSQPSGTYAGMYDNSLVPVLVSGITNATAITAGAVHSCALLVGGTIKCWGGNRYGQLANGTTTDSSVPVLVSGITNATAITAGWGHSCALLTGGTIKCWGNNDSGQLGNASLFNSSAPVLVSGITTANAITAGGSHSCALLADKTIACWGNNWKGELGNLTTTSSSVPVLVSGIANATAISAGVGIFGGHSCAILTGGTIKCWGYNNDGQLGDGTTIRWSVPVLVSGIANATAIAAGWGHSCAILTGGTIKCSGYNYNGQLGDGTTTDSSVPVLVSGITNAIAVTGGDRHSCALLTGGTIKCWGYNAWGELGDGTTTSSLVPVLVSGITTANAITAGGGHTCAILTGGTIKCWGYNVIGQLGNGTNTSSSVPVLVSGITTATAVTTGGSHSCALVTGGTIKCWGYNDVGQLGDGSRNHSSVPVLVSGITTATAITAGDWHSCALLAGGSIKCWGENRSGQLGNLSTNFSLVPVLVSGITTATAVTAGGSHSCSILTGGTIKCWGNNGEGQLGDGTTYTYSIVPVLVSGITSATAITAGDGHSCAILTGGPIKCWGYNDFGQLGNGINPYSSVPVGVIGL